MTFLKKPFKVLKEEKTHADGDKYIDLGELVFEGEGADEASTLVKVAEIYRYEDLNKLMDHVYNGNILVLDYNSISNDSLALKRITSELSGVARDINGDVAGVGKNLLMITPQGIRIDRHKIKGPY